MGPSRYMYTPPYSGNVIKTRGSYSGLWGCDQEQGEMSLIETSGMPYRGYSKLRTRAALGSYGRPMPRSIGPP